MNKFSTLKKWAAIIAVVAVSASDVLAQCSLTASVKDKRNVNCKGDNTGMFSLEQDGGRAPFQYSNDGGNTWQSAKNFNQLTAGTYNCVVKDRNLCTYNLTVVVTEPDFARILDCANCPRMED